jgi:hypothetical protein
VNDPERPANTSSIVLAQLLEPPCTDPYARWCGRGGAARLPPIPIAATLCLGTFRTSRRNQRMSALRGKAEVPFNPWSASQVAGPMRQGIA